MSGLMALGLAGSAISGVGSIIGGYDADSAAKYQARQGRILAKWEQQQLEQQARQDEAAGFVRARERRHEADLVQSSLQARAASSGAGTINPTVLNLVEDIAGRGEYLAQTEIAAGRMDAAAKRHRGAAGVVGAKMEGDILRLKGSSAKTAGIIGGIGSGLSSAADSYARYR